MTKNTFSKFTNAVNTVLKEGEGAPMKKNNISGYSVKSRSACKWCTNFVPFTGNGRKTCRLYELGHCRFEDGRNERQKKLTVAMF